MKTMSTILAAAAACALSVAAYAQQSGAQRSYNVGSFDSVSAGGPANVIVKVGGAPSVRAEGAPELLDRLEVVVEDGDLEIRPKWEYRRNFNWNDQRRATFYVTAPALEAAAVAGSGDMSVDRVQGEEFSGSVAGSGNLNIASVQVQRARFSIAGSGDLSARGSAARSNVSIAGSGSVKLQDLATRTAAVSIAGSGDVDMRAEEEVDVSIVGSGDVNVTGNARCSVNRIGGGNVRCGR